MNRQILRTVQCWLLLPLLLSACTSVEDMLPDRRPDYRTTEIANPLEVPPDLTSANLDDTLEVPEPAGGTRLSTYEQTERPADAGSDVVAQVPAGMRIERDGDRRWLVVEQPPDRLWSRIREFWTSNGFPLSRDDARLGIMETEWLENRADIPQGPIRAVLKQFLDFAYSAPTRDRFRVRLERTDEGTAIYLTHYGVEEIITVPGGGRQTASQTDVATWQPRPRDPELEAEMLRRLMLYLGASEERTRQLLASSEQDSDGTRVRLIENDLGQRALVVNRPYDDTWRLVGLALDSQRFVIEDQNRAQGLYQVEYRKTAEITDGDEGLLSRLAFWRDDDPENRPAGPRFRVRLAGQGPQTLVVVHNLQDQVADSTEALALLDSLQQSLQ
ncbi:MAG: outer membrane protein assembly factor BamC [Candidatus Competibacterales bacterium]|nr:outer membrane protein assembly factor BamC [Candidatus Competibacterales bacterium]